MTSTESQLLGLIFTDDSYRVMEQCFEHLPAGPESFVDRRHRILYEFLWRQWRDGKSLRISDVRKQLAEELLLEEIGGNEYLTEIASLARQTVNAVNPENAAYYLEIIREDWMLREALRYLNEAQTELRGPGARMGLPNTLARLLAQLRTLTT